MVKKYHAWIPFKNRRCNTDPCAPMCGVEKRLSHLSHKQELGLVRLQASATKKTMDTPETRECKALVQWMRKHPKIVNFTHIKNESYGPKQKWKRIADMHMGLRRGVPDYMVVTTKGIMFIEMKRRKGGVLSPKQKEWLKHLNEYGKVPAVECKGFPEAKNALTRFIYG